MLLQSIVLDVSACYAVFAGYVVFAVNAVFDGYVVFAGNAVFDGYVVFAGYILCLLDMLFLMVSAQCRL